MRKPTLTERLGFFDKPQPVSVMIINFIIQLLIAVALSVISYLIAPKPKTPKPDANRDLDNPTAESGRPIPVVWGTITVKGGNVLWYGDKGRRDYTVKG